MGVQARTFWHLAEDGGKPDRCASRLNSISGRRPASGKHGECAEPSRSRPPRGSRSAAAAESTSGRGRRSNYCECSDDHLASVCVWPATGKLADA